MTHPIIETKIWWVGYGHGCRWCNYRSWLMKYLIREFKMQIEVTAYQYGESN
jgi:hypothetical protein